MSITSANKTVSTDRIGCDGTFAITFRPAGDAERDQRRPHQPAQ